MTLPKHIKLVEVGPRDGLQNEKKPIPTDIKIAFINQLSETGLSMIETTSFVSAPKIPQLADGVEVMTGINKKPDVTYTALVPNRHGFESALKAHTEEIAVFTAASETFCQHNINCSIGESLNRFAEVTALAKEHGIKVRAYISCVVGCPYEGKISPELVTSIAEKLLALGCYEICLGDTIGISTAGQVIKLIEHVSQKIPLDKLAMHFHDTYGQALTNIYASLEKGITTFDASVSGLGGCPYAKGATGNVASEDVIYMMNGLGISTGVDLNKLMTAGNIICDFLKRPSGSKVARALSK